jgi:hypothetical protein
VLNFKSPLEVLQAKSLDLSPLKVFECFCFMHFPPSQRDKLDSRSNKCIFLGYSQTQKEYKGYNPSLNKMYTSRDVRFIKDIPYFFTTSRREDYFELFRCLVQVLLIRVHALCNVNPLMLKLIPVLTTLHQNQVLLVTFNVLI